VTATHSFRTASRLGLATTGLMYGLIVIGSIVRTTGSGLSCPDWPLCGGHLIPPFEPHVMIEWFHRLVALLVSLSLVLTLGWVVSHATVRRRLGGLAGLALVLLALQVVLGALTVWRLLSPAVVGSHLAVALLLFCSMLALTLLARGGAAGQAGAPARGEPAALPVGIAAVAAYGQCLLGGIVSATHAGSAATDWPTANGQWFPPLTGLLGIQVLHRYGAYTLVALVAVAAVAARRASDPRVRRGAWTALGLVLAQVVLGVLNLVLRTPPWLSALHLAVAVTILAVLFVATLRAAAPAWLPAARPGAAVAR